MFRFTIVLAAALLYTSGFGATPEVIDVEPVWSGHPVGFCLLTVGDTQYLGYYDASRQMTVASRKLDVATFTFMKLPSHVGWDSHNFIAMALDSAGQLHVTGNMHASPLVYFRTTRPGDVTSLVRVPKLVDAAHERRVTYPRFLHTPDGRLLCKYRDGSSGRGNDLYDVYDAKTETWAPFLHPLLDGFGEVNGYFSLPARGPDGAYRIVGVWRDTPDAATNHDLSYAQSRDLLHWETAGGWPLRLPLTMHHIDIVDPVPAHGGMINGNTKLGFDAEQRPIITYHKYDAAGDTQIYAARLENGTWVLHPVSDWKGYRWDFGGGGSLVFEVRLGAVHVAEGGALEMTYRYPHGRGTWILDPKTLRAVSQARTVRRGPRLPCGLSRVQSSFPGGAEFSGRALRPS